MPLIILTCYLQTWSAAEVAKHNRGTDLWLIIRDKEDGKRKVYDVTDYVAEHEGGEAIMKRGGLDNTEGFHGPQHMFKVFQMIHDYFIGYLDETESKKDQ